jgi:hypothetical protein
MGDRQTSVACGARCTFFAGRERWKLLRGEWFIIMSGIMQMEWHQTPGNHV